MFDFAKQKNHFGGFYEKIIKATVICAAVSILFAFAGCSSPSSSGNSNATDNTQNTDTSSQTDDDSDSDVSTEDPFAGTTWVCDQSNTYITFITTIKFSTTGNVDYTMNSAGTITSIYSGPYTVILSIKKLPLLKI